MSEKVTTREDIASKNKGNGGFLWSSPMASFHSKLMKLYTEDTGAGYRVCSFRVILLYCLQFGQRYRKVGWFIIILQPNVLSYVGFVLFILLAPAEYNKKEFLANLSSVSACLSFESIWSTKTRNLSFIKLIIITNSTTVHTTDSYIYSVIHF